MQNIGPLPASDQIHIGSFDHHEPGRPSSSVPYDLCLKLEDPK
jgi:hypothetical protein